MKAVDILLTHLMQYVIDGNKAFGQASLRRTNKLVEHFRVVVQGVKIFHAQNTRVVLSEPFEGKFVQWFNKDLQECTESIPAGEHVEAGSRDDPGSERRIADVTTAFHANP